MQTFLESPALANGGWETFLRRRRAVGTFAVPVETAKSGRTLRWLTVDLLQPKISETRCQFTADGDVNKMEFDSTHIRAIQWGKLGEVQIPKLDWPNFPLRRLGTDDFAGMVRLMSVMT